MSQPSPTEAARTAERGPQSVICARTAALVRERWGRGPRRSRAYFAGPDTLVVLLDDAHTDAERTLIEHDHAEDVLAGRRLLGELTHGELRQIVQSALRRPVTALLSESCVSPALTTHVFTLGPEPQASPGERLGDAVRRALDQAEASQALGAEAEQAARQSARHLAGSRKIVERPRRPVRREDA